MIIEFEGETWEFDSAKITLQQGVKIEEAYGFTLNQWFRACEDASSRALQCLYWLMLQQKPGARGAGIPIKSVNCEIVALADAFHVAQAAEDAAEAGQAAQEPEPDPTPASPSPPGSPPTDVLIPRARGPESALAAHRTGS